MKSDQKTIEATGKSVEDAIQSGLTQLGCDITDVHIDILEEGSKGFFGLFGSKPAKVRLTQHVDDFDDLDLESLLRPGASTRVSTVSAPKQPDKPQPKPAPSKPQAPASQPKQQSAQDRQPSKQAPAQGEPSPKQPAQAGQSPKQQPAQDRPPRNSDRPSQPPRSEKPQPSQPKPAKSQSDSGDASPNQRPPRVSQPRQDRPQSDGDASKPVQAARPPRAQAPRTDKPQQRGPQTPHQPRPERAPKPPRNDEPSPRLMIPEGPLPDQDPETLPPESRVAYDYLSQATKLMGVDVKIYIAQNENTLSISMMGDALGILIGRRGETLDALQYLTSLEVNKDREQYMRVALDTENYRAKREDSLNRLAARMAARARKTGRKVVLEPMNPYERRVLHSMLQNDPYVQTHSEGDEPNRRVVITLKPGVAPEGGVIPNIASNATGAPATSPRPPRPPRRPAPAQASADADGQAPRESREPRGPRPPRPPRPQRTYPHAQLEKKPLSSILGDDFEQCQNEFDERQAAETAAQKPQTIMQASIEFSDDDTE